MKKSLGQLHRALLSYALIFVVWGLYRLLLRFPEEIEETVIKPIVFIGAVLLIERPKQWFVFFRQVWGKGNWLVAAGLGIALGFGYVLFYGVSSIIAFGTLQLGSEAANNVWISFVSVGLTTALWEEFVFSGYVLRALSAVDKSQWIARIVTAVLFASVHLPILAFWYKFTGPVLLFQLLLLFVLGFGNATAMGRSKNLLTPVIAHTLWGVAIFLFR